MFSLAIVFRCDRGDLGLLQLIGQYRGAIAGIRSFLLRRLGPHTDSLANRAATYLRKTPTMQMNCLAASLGSSPRQLSPAFKAYFGVGPKRFARLARVQRIRAERPELWRPKVAGVTILS